jgi:hypothetical protein
MSENKSNVLPDQAAQSAQAAAISKPLTRGERIDGYRNTANSSVSNGKWKFILIMVVALIATISSGVSFFTAKYRLKKAGQETEVDNISNSSGVVFVMSLLLVVFTAFFVFAKL